MKDEKADDIHKLLDSLGNKADSLESSCPVRWATVGGISISVEERIELEGREKIRAEKVSSREELRSEQSEWESLGRWGLSYDYRMRGGTERRNQG